MNTCKNCIFWDLKNKSKEGISECNKFDDNTKDKTKTFELDLFVDDSSGLNYSLMTGENFGCVLHEPK